MILAPLRGVTIRCFRETFADVIREVGFDEAITPFVPALSGFDPLKDRELRGLARTAEAQGLRVTPQFIGKDPVALRDCLLRLRQAGFETADLNGGCPFPMVRNKGRGSGLLRTPDVLQRMIAAGCETMGPGRFSLKVRLGVDRTDELERLMPMINRFPLRFLTVHARTARQMYAGDCDSAAMERIRAVARVPIVVNGDIPFPLPASLAERAATLMIGRSFVRYLGTRQDIGDRLRRYVSASCGELCGEAPVLGRMKELIAYWKDLPRWTQRWNLIKICRSTDELCALI